MSTVNAGDVVAALNIGTRLEYIESRSLYRLFQYSGVDHWFPDINAVGAAIETRLKRASIKKPAIDN